uniref:Uncharacterized protein n=1 Tax=Trypanosoma vivax (strain Y486) TaxID=1055687 RepID=G0UDB3_TRYVY|nr:hypothetical protein, unlikely [Trypanosoma vivax Y486]
MGAIFYCCRSRAGSSRPRPFSLKPVMYLEHPRHTQHTRIQTHHPSAAPHHFHSLLSFAGVFSLTTDTGVATKTALCFVYGLVPTPTQRTLFLYGFVLSLL